MAGLKADTIRVGVSKTAVSWIVGRNKNLNTQQVLNIISNMLGEILALTLIDLRAFIKTKVPKRTGQLRKNLLDNMESSRAKEKIMHLIIKTSIDYASKVNEMTTSQVRHVNEAREYASDYTTKKGKKHYPYAYAYYFKHFGRIRLNDPLAIGNFFDALEDYSLERILINLQKTRNKYESSTKLTARQTHKVDVMSNG